jgi:hypothetical protein
LMHIFRNAPGHLTQDNAFTRSIIQSAVQEKNYVGMDSHGSVWYAQTYKSGVQSWAQVRDGVVQNGGLNLTAINVGARLP